jgi:archaellum component FlaC
MLKNVKKAAMSQAMKLMSNPKVGKLLSDPRVMNAITKGFEVHGQIRSSVEGKLRTLADSLNLVSKEELSNITSKLNQVESSVGDLVAKVEEVAKKRVVRKKKKAATPSS